MNLIASDITLFKIDPIQLEMTRLAIVYITGLVVELQTSDIVPKMAMVIKGQDGETIDYICEGDILVVRDYGHPKYAILTPELHSFLFKDGKQLTYSAGSQHDPNTVHQ